MLTKKPKFCLIRDLPPLNIRKNSPGGSPQLPQPKKPPPRAQAKKGLNPGAPSKNQINLSLPPTTPRP